MSEWVGWLVVESFCCSLSKVVPNNSRGDVALSLATNLNIDEHPFNPEAQI